MNKAMWVTLLATGMLPAAGYADDAKVSNTDGESPPQAMPSVEASHAKLAHTFPSHLLHPGEAITYLDDWPRPLAKFDFQDDSALARVSKLRNLSLLTVAEFGRTRLFLGVNADGLVGLHFKRFSRAGDARYLEVVRMPYLRENEPDRAVRQSGPSPDDDVSLD
jgi:hypothetical protein